MAVVSTPIFPQAINNGTCVLTNTTYQVVFLIGGATNGTRVNFINVVSTDTSARDVILYIYYVSATYQLTQVSIPITAGTLNTVPPVNLLTSPQIPNLPRDPAGNPYILLTSADTIYVSAGTQPTSGKQLTLFAIGENF